MLALVESVHGSARTIQTKQGDDGIDIYVGPFTKPIDVYQTKFFPTEISASQKSQIRNSFSTCLKSTKFTMKSWTLCVPRDMTIDETSGSMGWRAKQQPMIETPWTAGKLESLLMRDENKGVKEHFFKEEHLSQIRDIHGIVKQLTAELEPQTFSPMIERLEPLRIAEFEGQRILCLKVHFLAE